jgi:predicted ATPase
MLVAPVFCRRFIGREAELALLTQRWRDACAGTGSLVLLAGEAGIGKTRFLDEVRTALEPAGARFAQGQCWRHARSPLGPIAETLRLLHEADPQVVDAAAR